LSHTDEACKPARRKIKIKRRIKIRNRIKSGIRIKFRSRTGRRLES